jgi:Family of unknown function (DUF6353)
MALVPAAVTRKIGRQLLTFKKQSPHIFFVAGLVGSVTSTVLACRATLKLSNTLDEIETDIRSVKLLKENSEKTGTVAYNGDEYGKDLTYVYTRATIKIARLYGPSVIIGVGSIAMLTRSHIELSKRNAALMAAYATLQQAYDDYRERVREELGESKELDLYHGATTERVKNEDGKSEDIKVVDPNKMSPYSRIFDEYSPHWEKDPELNKLYIQCQQNYANDLLITRGHVFLNEVYDMLGFDRSKAGAVVGWVMGNDGDNYIDFSLYEARNSAFVNGWERSIFLDFNVDGVILDKI